MCAPRARREGARPAKLELGYLPAPAALTRPLRAQAPLAGLRARLLEAERTPAGRASEAPAAGHAATPAERREGLIGTTGAENDDSC